MASRNLFKWTQWRQGIFPDLKLHSELKLKILSEYIEEYICILCQGLYGIDSFKLTIVDGFAGGGVYAGGREGSPLQILRAVKAAEARLNQTRKSKLRIDAHFYFIEEAKAAFECLDNAIRTSEFGSEVARSIFVLKGDFNVLQEKVVAACASRFGSSGARVIFFLDQCGYSQVPAQVIRQISEKLSYKAEYIINMALEWFKDYVSDDEQFEQLFLRSGFGDSAAFRRLLSWKKECPSDWRYVMEAQIGPAYCQTTGSQHCSPFYIVPENNRRGYWLLHLAPHARALFAMRGVHWRRGNNVHMMNYAGKGLSMLAWNPKEEGILKGIRFSDLSKEECIKQLTIDFPRRLRDQAPGGIKVGELLAKTCNETMANREMMLEALSAAAQLGELLITGPNGGSKKVHRVTVADVVRPDSQLFFPGLQAARP